MTARTKLAPILRVARSLPAAAVLVLGGLALVSLASSSRPTGLEATLTGDGSLPSTTTNNTAGATLTTVDTSGAPPSTSADQAGPTTTEQDADGSTDSTTDRTVADEPNDAITRPSAGPADATSSPSPDNESSNTSVADENSDETTLDNTETTTQETNQGSAPGESSDAPTTTTNANESDQDPANQDPADQDPADQDPADQEAAGDGTLPEDSSGQEDANSEAAAEDEQSLLQNALSIFIALVAVLGVLSLLVPPLWSAIQHWRDRDNDESLRGILWQWFRDLLTGGDEEVADSIKAAPILNPIVMLDRLRSELESEPDPRKAVRKAYAAVESGFGNVEMARHKSETPSAYLERALGSIIEGENRPLAQLTHLFLLARYSQHKITEEMRDEAVEAVVDLRSRYRKSEAVLI